MGREAVPQWWENRKWEKHVITKIISSGVWATGTHLVKFRSFVAIPDMFLLSHIGVAGQWAVMEVVASYNDILYLHTAPSLSTAYKFLLSLIKCFLTWFLCFREPESSLFIKREKKDCAVKQTTPNTYVLLCILEEALMLLQLQKGRALLRFRGNKELLPGFLCC